MARIHQIFLFLIVCFASQISLSNGQMDIISKVYRVFLVMSKINRGKAYAKDLEAIMTKQDPVQTYIKLLEELQVVSKGIAELKIEYEVNSKLMIETLIEKLEIRGDLRIAMDHLLDHLDVIDSRYNRFAEIYLETNNTGVTMLEDFFMAVTSEYTTGLDHELKMMYLLVDGSSRKGMKLLDLMNRHMKDKELQHCDDSASSQQHIYNLFNNIAMREMNAFIMIVTGYLYLQNNGKGDYTNGISITTAATEKRLMGYANEVQKVMARASTAIVRCGPTSADRTGVIELKGSFQGIIIDDGPSNIRCQSGERNVCVSPKRIPTKFSTGNDVCMYQKENQCLGQSCYNEMTDCESVSEQVVVCNADPYSHRRYDYVKTGHIKKPRETDIYYRNKTDHCYQTPRQGMATYIRAGWTIYSCYFCMCTCMGNAWKESDLRAISFLEQSTNISESKVVVGVRFFEKNGMVHLQIKQGTVLSGGRIQEKSEEWKPIENIVRKFTSKNPEIPPDYYLDNVTGNIKLEQQVQYTHISKDFRSMSLSNVLVPIGYLITGVKFQFERHPTSSQDVVIGDTIELRIRATPFNFDSGKFSETADNPSIYIAASMNRNQDVQRKRVEFQNPDVSTDAPKNEVDSNPPQVVDFRVTDYRKDAGQTIIPFFDTRAVEAIPNTPLSGIGLYFRGSRGYGGFIAPKIFTLDINNYFVTNFTLSGISLNDPNQLKRFLQGNQH